MCADCKAYVTVHVNFCIVSVTVTCYVTVRACWYTVCRICVVVAAATTALAAPCPVLLSWPMLHLNCCNELMKLNLVYRVVVTRLTSYLMPRLSLTIDASHFDAPNHFWSDHEKCGHFGGAWMECLYLRACISRCVHDTHFCARPFRTMVEKP